MKIPITKIKDIDDKIYEYIFFTEKQLKQKYRRKYLYVLEDIKNCFRFVYPNCNFMELKKYYSLNDEKRIFNNVQKYTRVEIIMGGHSRSECKFINHIIKEQIYKEITFCRECYNLLIDCQC